MAKRGEFTPHIQAFMEDFLGRPTSRAEDMRLSVQEAVARHLHTGGSVPGPRGR